jgi:hypothetical protein
MDEDSYEAEYTAAVEAWREKHHLREDDAVLLLIDLFRVHQKHWDELRRRRPPGCEDLHLGIAQITALVASFQKQATKLVHQLTELKTRQEPSGVNFKIAALSVMIATLGGYFIGRGWP